MADIFKLCPIVAKHQAEHNDTINLDWLREHVKGCEECQHIMAVMAQMLAEDEEAPPYGLQPRYHTVASYHLYHRGEATTHPGNVLEVEARDALEAATLALAAVKRLTPSWGTVFNLQLVVSLSFDEGSVMPDRRPCFDCGGTGREPMDTTRACLTCDGTGLEPE